SAVPVEAPFEVNEAKIAEMQNRIQDLQRQELVAQAALAQQARQLGGATHESQSQQPGGGGTGEQRPEEDPIHAERKRRAYVSVFASNVDLQAASLPAIPWNMGTRTLPLRRGLFAAVGSLLALKRPSSAPDILTALNFAQRAK